jgi:hypothetical protein
VKKLLLVTCVSLFAITLTAGEWTGYISESGCGAKHNDGSAASIKCVQSCVKRGAAPVFVTEDGKVVKIEDSSKSKVMEVLGQKVKVTGELNDDTLKIDTVSKAD